MIREIKEKAFIKKSMYYLLHEILHEKQKWNRLIK